MPQTAASAQAGGVIPEQGFGWTKDKVYVGFSLETDASTVGGVIGVKTFDFGDQKRAFQIAIDAVNATGGLLGRKIVPVYYDYNSLNSNAAQQASAACSTWFEDNHVVAVLSFVYWLAIDPTFQCIKQHGSWMLTREQFATQSHMASWRPWVNFNGPVVSADRLAQTWRDQFAQLGFFHGWDTTQGAPGPEPVKIGIVYSNADPEAREAWHVVAQILGARAPVVVEEVSDPTKLQSVVLAFRNAGVTHVFMDPASGLFWTNQAESQHYRPRLGLSTYNLPNYYMAGVAPPQQLAGSLVAGSFPAEDVDANRDPHDTPGLAACLAIFKKASYPPGSNQGHLAIAVTACDMVFLLARSVRLGNGFGLQAIRAGYQQAMRAFPWAETWSASYSPDRPDPLNAFRPATYDASGCQCYAYTTKRNIPIG